MPDEKVVFEPVFCSSEDTLDGIVADVHMPKAHLGVGHQMRLPVIGVRDGIAQVSARWCGVRELSKLAPQPLEDRLGFGVPMQTAPLGGEIQGIRLHLDAMKRRDTAHRRHGLVFVKLDRIEYISTQMDMAFHMHDVGPMLERARIHGRASIWTT